MTPRFCNRPPSLIPHPLAHRAKKTGPGQWAGAGILAAEIAGDYFSQIAFIESAMLPGVVMILVKVPMVSSGQCRAMR